MRVKSGLVRSSPDVSRSFRERVLFWVIRHSSLWKLSKLKLLKRGGLPPRSAKFEGFAEGRTVSAHRAGAEELSLPTPESAAKVAADTASEWTTPRFTPKGPRRGRPYTGRGGELCTSPTPPPLTQLLRNRTAKGKDYTSRFSVSRAGGDSGSITCIENLKNVSVEPFLMPQLH